MSPRRLRRSESLVLDPDVLRPGPVCEFGASIAVAAQGGITVQPWRDLNQADREAGLAVATTSEEIADASHRQAVVHLQKSRSATFGDLVEAWRILEPGGELLLTGSNALGIASAVKRLGTQLDQPGIVVANRAHARVVRFRKSGDAAPQMDEPNEPIQVALPPTMAAGAKAKSASRSNSNSNSNSSAGSDPETGAAEPAPALPESIEIETAPGVFSAKRLDAGSELLIQALAPRPGEKAPRRVVDLGCGTGVLGLVAALLYPQAECLLVDADARAVECARRNAARLGLAGRVRVLWWDAREKPPESDFELALVNPPFHHRGPEVDLGPALALFESLATWLTRNGRALVVANRTLPYEAPLARLGELESLADAQGYKLLSLVRSARSSASRGRKPPGSRSGGSSRSPIRSR